MQEELEPCLPGSGANYNAVKNITYTGNSNSTRQILKIGYICEKQDIAVKRLDNY